MPKKRKDAKIEKEIENLFGEEKNRNYRIKRNLFFILVSCVFLFLFIFRRYFQVVNILSVVGLGIVLFLFRMADNLFEIKFKRRHYFFAFLIILISILLSFLYFKYPYFDKLQHLFFPMMLGSMIFYMVSKLKLEKKYTLWFTFFIVIGLLSMFELLEYFVDIILGFNLQGVFIKNPQAIGGFDVVMSRIDDTMADILIGTIGSLIYIGSVFFILKKKNKKSGKKGRKKK